ncbi:MAG: glycosyltransferase family 39 protein [Anaerolineae bacterium]|nr:glycosyltransferase family 39 protein [Anaerolineae bacterium]
MNPSENEIMQFFDRHQKKFLPLLVLLLAFWGSIAIGDQALIADWWGVILWVTAIVLCFHIMVGFSSLHKIQVNWRTVAIFVSLFLLAFLVRVIRIHHLPALLNGDESGSALDAVKFLQGEWNNIFTSGWFSFPAMHPFIQAIYIRLIGANAAGVRMSSVVIGALTIPVLYLVAREMFDEIVALAAAILLSVLPIHNHMSRIGLNNIWDPFFFLAAIGFLWRGWKRESRFSYFIAGLALGFSQYFYATSRALIPLILLVIGVLFLVDRGKTRSQAYWLIFMLVLGAVVMMPLYYFYTKHPMDFQAPFVRVSVFDRDWMPVQLQNGRTVLSVVWYQVATAVKGIISFPVHGYYEAGTPILLMPAAFLFELGFILMAVQLVIRKFRDERVLLIFGWMVTIVLGVVLSVDTPASQRYTAVLPALSLVAAYGLVEGVNLVKLIINRRSMNLRWVVSLVVLLIFTRESWFYLETFPHRDTLGGVNTLIANDFAAYLNATDEPFREVIFYGYPNMGYDSIAALPLLVPDVHLYTSMTGRWGEVPETPQSPGDRLTFFFLDVNFAEALHIQELFPGGFLFDRCIRNSPIWNGCYYIYEYRNGQVEPPNF